MDRVHNNGYATMGKQILHTHKSFFVFFLSGSVMAVGDHLLQAITHPGDELWMDGDQILR